MQVTKQILGTNYNYSLCHTEISVEVLWSVPLWGFWHPPTLAVYHPSIFLSPFFLCGNTAPLSSICRFKIMTEVTGFGVNRAAISLIHTLVLFTPKGWCQWYPWLSSAPGYSSWVSCILLSILLIKVIA